MFEITVFQKVAGGQQVDLPRLWMGGATETIQSFINHSATGQGAGSENFYSFLFTASAGEKL